jgi:hypothetical protein
VVESEELVHIWRDGGRTREERALGERSGSYGVRVGDLWWHWDAHLGASSNQDDREAGSGIGEQLTTLLSPAVVLGSLRFRVAERRERAGRATITAEAIPRSELDNGRVSFELHELGSGADRYTLDVDAERGVLLGVLALRDGEPFQEITAVDIAFDELIDDEVFVFRPPAGEEVHSVRARVRPEHVPLTEAQQRAPFTVFMPSRVPDDWQMHCVYIEPSQRPRAPASVALDYRSDSGHESVHISQQSAADKDSVFNELTAGHGWHEVVRDGTVIHVAKGGLQAQVHLERAGTFVFLMSETLSVEQLATIAAGLVLAPSTSGI